MPAWISDGLRAGTNGKTVQTKLCHRVSAQICSVTNADQPVVLNEWVVKDIEWQLPDAFQVDVITLGHVPT